MSRYDPETIRHIEQRLAALEAECKTPKEKELMALMLRIFQSLISALWLINGGVKYLAAPIGFAWAAWTYGADAAAWLAGFFQQGPKP